MDWHQLKLPPACLARLLALTWAVPGLAQGPSFVTRAFGATVLANALYCPDTSGAANTITCIPTVPPSAYTVGQSFAVKLANTVTGATTINVNTLGAVAVTKNGATPLAANDLVAGGIYLMTYDGTEFVVSQTASTTGPAFGGYSSAAAISFSGTQFLPIVGGGAPSGTETAVQLAAPFAGTFQKFTVKNSVAPGLGNSIALTVRDNATSQSVTCTLGATSNNCTDLTHSFTFAQNDLLDIQTVATGTPAATNLYIAYQLGNIAATTLSGSFEVHLPLGYCSGVSTAALAWDTPPTGITAATAGGCSGTNVNDAYGVFANAGTPSLQWSLTLPQTLTTDKATVYLNYLTATASGTFTPALDLVCTPSNGTTTNDPTFTANNFFSPGSQTAPGTANWLQTVSQSALTWPANCTGGNRAHFRLIRTDTSGTATNVNFVEVVVVGRRTM